MGGLFTNTFNQNPTTADVKNILNTIMREMFRRSDMVDLYSLADPNRCSKYVMVGAKTLDKLFSSVNLVPAMGADGRVFFQKIDVIQKANPLGESHQETCKLLAFFFIRIFRIYAALTLSIKDSELPETEPIEKVKKEYERKGLVVMKPGYLQGFRAPPKPEAASWFRGGALKSDIPARAGFAAINGSGNYYLEPTRVGRYKILNLYLNVPTDQVNPLDSNEDLHFYDSPELRIPQDTLYEFADAANKAGTRLAKRFTEATTSRPIVIYTFRDSQSRFRNIVGGLFLEDNAGKLEVSLQHIHLDGKPMSTPSETELLIPLTPTDENPKTKEQKNLTEALKGLFKKVFEKVEPAQFSGIDFLKKHNIISSMDGNVRMENTSVFVVNPKRYRARASFPIIFADKLEVGKKEIDVRLEADIALVKENKTESEQGYKLYIDPDSIRVKPEKLTGYIKKPSLRDHVFYTGVDDASAPKNRKGHTIPEYLQRVLRNIFSGNMDSLGSGLSYDKQMRAIPYNSEDIPEEFRVKDTWKSLTRDPPIKAHCVARAIQLLNVTAIRDEKSGEGYSSICRVKFPYVTDGSLPKPGESILTEDGIKGLAMLYIDGFADNKLFPTNTQEFAQFRLRMKGLFERYETIEDDDEPPKSFNDIREKQMPFCKDRGEKRLRVRGELVKTLRYKVYELLKQQQIHIAKCMQILFKLFKEESIRNGNLEMSDYVIGYGMDALNQLAEEARGVLIDYYSSCEETYKEGLFEINKNPDSIVDV